MPSADSAVSVAEPADAEAIGMDNARPVLFLHIPKTAGTSFLLMLQNAFGDNAVRRFHTVDGTSQSLIDRIVETELDKVSCLTGHLPIHLFSKHLDRFQPFTVLREPVSRVLSLFRFLKARDPAEMRRLGLQPGCSLKEFLDSRRPGIYGQINNGMVRLLCGDARMVDADYPEFWDEANSVKTLDLALANLARMDFGVTEAMEQTLKLAQVKWSVPYGLRQYRENATSPDVAGEDVADVVRIVSSNTLDLALYHWACTEFRKRMRALEKPGASGRWNSRAVFAPVVNEIASVGDIAGRQGFHEFEEIGLAWLYAEHMAEIQFVAQAHLARLRLHFFCVIPRYPVEDIVVSVNGGPVSHEFTFVVNEKWGWLETDHFDTRQGLNMLTIQVPLYAPAADLEPGSGDLRQLGVALANVALVKSR